MPQQNEKVYRWVKASERKPENRGKENSVVVRCIKPNSEFVTMGFTNYNEKKPAIYMEVGRLSFLTVDEEGDFHSSVGVKYIEWLEETPSLQTELDQTKKLLDEVLAMPCIWKKDNIRNGKIITYLTTPTT